MTYKQIHLRNKVNNIKKLELYRNVGKCMTKFKKKMLKWKKKWVVSNRESYVEFSNTVFHGNKVKGGNIPEI